MSYFFKHILPAQSIIPILYLIVILWNWWGDWGKILTTGIPVLFLIFKIYYDKSKYVFTYCRKVCARWKNPGVHWSCSYVYTLQNDIIFKDLSRNFVNILREKGYNIENIIDGDNNLRFTIKDTNLNIYYEESEQEIKVEYGTNISYRDSIKVFQSDFLLYKHILENLTANTNESLYSLKLKFEEYNPFYSLYIKNYADIKIDSFKLDYSVDNLNMEISDKVMVIHSENKESIIKALKNYLIVSK